MSSDTKRLTKTERELLSKLIQNVAKGVDYVPGTIRDIMGDSPSGGKRSSAYLAAKTLMRLGIVERINGLAINKDRLKEYLDSQR